MLAISFLKVVTAIVLFVTPPPTISKAQLINLKCIYELSAELPTDIKVYAVSIVGKMDGNTIEYGSQSIMQLKNIEPNGCDVTQEVRDFLKQVDVGKKVYLDFKYMRADEDFPRAATFGFMVTE